MDLPIDTNELRDVIIALQIASNSTENEKFTIIADRLILVQELMVQGKPYKKVLREQYDIVA